MNIAIKTASQTAAEALAAMRATLAQVSRLYALMSAIRADAAQGQAINLDALTSMGMELGENMVSDLDHQIDTLQDQLDAVGGAA